MVEIACERGTIDLVAPSNSVAVCFIPSRVIDRNEVMSTGGRVSYAAIYQD